jgi:hypothetical protein
MSLREGRLAPGIVHRDLLVAHRTSQQLLETSRLTPAELSVLTEAIDKARREFLEVARLEEKAL